MMGGDWGDGELGACKHTAAVKMGACQGLCEAPKPPFNLIHPIPPLPPSRERSGHVWERRSRDWELTFPKWGTNQDNYVAHIHCGGDAMIWVGGCSHSWVKTLNKNFKFKSYLTVVNLTMLIIVFKLSFHHVGHSPTLF